MLPQLKKPTQQQFQASQIKLYNPPRQLPNYDAQYQRKSSMMSSSRVNTKIRAMAGSYRKEDPAYDSFKGPVSSSVVHKSLQQANYATLSMQHHQNNPTIAGKMQFAKLSSNTNLSAEIKLIEKKIRYHKKKLQQEKKRKQEEENQKNDPYSSDFQKIIKREMELNGYGKEQEEKKGFDYLTNPGGRPKEEDQEQQEQVKQPQKVAVILQPRKFDISQKVQKLQRHYQHSLKKKFQRRQMFPHYPCKRKTPKLYVTAKTNALQKFGKKPAYQQHLFRVMTKECTPQEIYPTIPNFAIVKDSLSKNVMAYLSDFRPFVEKTREEGEEILQGKNEEGGVVVVKSQEQRPESQKRASASGGGGNVPA